MAEKTKKKFKACCIIIDEIDSLFQKRDKFGTEDASHVYKRVTELFLRLMGKPPRIMLIGTTNYIENIDNAILTRESRIEKVIFINQRKEMLLKRVKMYKLLVENLTLADQDEDISITVITGSGDFYSSGNDFSLSESKNIVEDQKKTIILVQNFVDALIRHSKVLVALVNGPAIGIACTTLALFECVICTYDSYFLCPFTKLGLVLEGTSSQSFPLIMGHSRAAQMLLFSEKVTSNEAKEAGLVNRIIPRHQFKEESERILQKYLQLVPQSLLKGKRLMRTDYQKQLLHSANQVEIEAIQHQWTQPETYEKVQKAFAKPSPSKL